MRYKHIIWDYDGTLFDSYPVMAAAFHDALTERNIVESMHTILSFMKVSMGATITHYKEEYQLDDSFFERFATLKKNAEMQNTKPIDGVIELCNSICKHGGKNYLFTHRSESAIFFMKKYDLLKNFTELITAKHNFPRKPSPDAILYLKNKYHFAQDQSIMIGDRDIDILSAKNAGIHTCYFSSENEVSSTADFSINRFSTLYKIFEI